MCRDSEPLLTTKQLAEMFGLSVATLERWRANEETDQPPYIRFNTGAIRYNPCEVREWLRNHSVKLEGAEP